MTIPFKNFILFFCTKKQKLSVIKLPLKKEINAVFFVLPEKKEDFENSLLILNHLIELKKKITILVYSPHLHLIKQSYLIQVIEYFPKDKVLEEIPKGFLLNRLKNFEFDLAIDLDRGNDLFSTICISFIKSEHKIGLSKPHSGKFFNIQFVSDKNDSYNTYSNLKNCLQKLITL